ncbi:MAG: hypothetical protein KA250_16355 [Verrucomicrobiales bacterium]|jgi:hypothetical protein|nr:hypothetical protein [Verrucomicrobiales bacterium]
MKLWHVPLFLGWLVLSSLTSVAMDPAFDTLIPYSRGFEAAGDPVLLNRFLIFLTTKDAVKPVPGGNIASHEQGYVIRQDRLESRWATHLKSGQCNSERDGETLALFHFEGDVVSEGSRKVQPVIGSAQ